MLDITGIYFREGYSNFKISTNRIYVRSQIRQITERFFHQSGFFEYSQNTTFGIDNFFILRSMIGLYEMLAGYFHLST